MGSVNYTGDSSCVFDKGLGLGFLLSILMITFASSVGNKERFYHYVIALVHVTHIILHLTVFPIVHPSIPDEHVGPVNVFFLLSWL